MITVKAVKSESGMILATVLMLIVIFSVIGITIINFTVTNAKQTSNIEKDMQLVDIAEMGIIRYRSELVPKLNAELKDGIEQAVASLDQKNEQIAEENAKRTQNLTPYIEINATAVIEEMKRIGFFNNMNRFKIGYSPNNTNSVYPGSKEIYSLEELPSNLYPTTIEIKVKSIGKSDNNSNEIEANFNIDLAYIINEYLIPGEIKAENNTNLPYLWTNNAVDKSIGIKDCGYTKKLETGCIYPNRFFNGYYIDEHIFNIESYLKENLIVQKGDLTINESNLYVEGNIMTSTIKELKNSNIQAEGNITYGNMNGSSTIENVMFKSTDKINIGTIGGSGILNSKIHAGEQLNIDEINNGGINGSELSSKKEINFKNLNKGIVNSLIYANDNINFQGNMNDGGIINSKIITNDILNFKIMNKGITDSFIHAKNNMNFDTFNGGANIVNSIIRTDDILYFSDHFDGNIQNGTVIYSGKRINYLKSNFKGSVDSSSYICSKGSIPEVIKKKATNNNVIENVGSFEKCLELSGKKLSTTTITKSELKDFSEVIETSVNEAEYIYK